MCVWGCGGVGMCVCVWVGVGVGVGVWLAKFQMCVFNAFVCSANVHLQREMHSSPPQNTLISSAYSVRLQHKTRSSLAINMFVCMQCVIVFGGDWQRLTRH